MANEVEVYINEHKCFALLDTGSTVSTITRGMYEKYFTGVQINKLEEMLNVESVVGHSLPLIHR